MLGAMTARDYLRWTRTYRQEPFGGMGDSLRNYLMAVATTKEPDLRAEMFNPGDETRQEQDARKALETARADFRDAQVRLGG